MQGDPQFIRLRRHHSAVELAINALEVHGLDRCPDQGIRGFKRYAALAVVARNIQRLGAILYEQARERERRKRGLIRLKSAVDERCSPSARSNGDNPTNAMK